MGVIFYTVSTSYQQVPPLSCGAHLHLLILYFFSNILSSSSIFFQHLIFFLLPVPLCPNPTPPKSPAAPPPPVPPHPASQLRRRSPSKPAGVAPLRSLSHPARPFNAPRYPHPHTRPHRRCANPLAQPHHAASVQPCHRDAPSCSSPCVLTVLDGGQRVGALAHCKSETESDGVHLGRDGPLILEKPIQPAST